jgi:hypothetical protein
MYFSLPIRPPLKLHPLAKDPGLIFKMKKFKNEENERSLI